MCRRGDVRSLKFPFMRKQGGGIPKKERTDVCGCVSRGGDTHFTGCFEYVPISRQWEHVDRLDFTRLPIYLVKSSPWFPELDLLVVPTTAFQRRVHKSR